MDFLFALLDGGSELKAASDYMWLVQATVVAGLKPSDIDELAEQLKSKTEDKSKAGLLAKGLSFNITDEHSYERERLEKLVWSLAREAETAAASKIMDFLYEAVRNVGNKKLSAEEKRMDRLILAALMKQLGIGGELVYVFDMLLAGEKGMVISPYTKQIMHCIYMIRRELKFVKQKTRARVEDTAETDVPLTELYEDYVREIVRKCAFLVHIQPPLRFQSEDFTGNFGVMLGRIQAFLLSPVTIDTYFEALMTMSEARSHVSMGLSLSTEVLAECEFDVCRELMVDRYGSGRVIGNIADSLESTNNRVWDQVKQIISYVEGQLGKVDPRIWSGFLMNVARDVKEKNAEKGLQILQILLDGLCKVEGGLNDVLFPVITDMSVMAKTDTAGKTGTRIGELMAGLVGQKSRIGQESLELAALVAMCGVGLPASDDECIDTITNAGEKFHAASEIVYQYVKCHCKAHSVIAFLLKEISEALGNGVPGFSCDMKGLNEDGVGVGDRVRSANIVLWRCTELLSVFRRILSEGGDAQSEVLSILSYILKRFSPDGECDRDPSLDVFDNDLLLHAVFAILSNAVNVVGICSLLRDRVTNRLYYVADVNSRESSYVVWSLPITSASRPMKLDFNENLIPYEFVPFSKSMFPETALLIPYFLKALSGDLSGKLCYSLRFLILRSAIEYSKDTEVLVAMLNSGRMRADMETVFYGDSTSAMQQIIRSRIWGMDMYKPCDEFRFYQCSPTPLEAKFSISEEKLISKSQGVNIFVSSFLPNGRSTIDMSVKAEAIDFGLYSPDVAHGSQDQCIVSFREDEIIGCDTGGEWNPNGNNLLHIEYDGSCNGLLTWNGDELVRKSFPTAKRPVCFIVILHDQGEVEYTVTTQPLTPETQASWQDKVIGVPPLGSAASEKLVTFSGDIMDRIPSSFEKDPDPSLKMVPCSFGRCEALTSKNANLHVPCGRLYESEQSPELISVYCCGDETCLAVDPVSGNVVTREGKATKLQYLPALTPLNYAILPPHFLELYGTWYADLLGVQTKSFLFAHAQTRARARSFSLCQILHAFVG